MVRHGESEWNKLNLFCGWYDADLSDKGTTVWISHSACMRAFVRWFIPPCLLREGGWVKSIWFERSLKGVTFVVTMHVPVERVRYMRCITKLFHYLVPTNWKIRSGLAQDLSAPSRQIIWRPWKPINRIIRFSGLHSGFEFGPWLVTLLNFVGSSSTAKWMDFCILSFHC